jgi:alginate O-acetyltransferase complex protein AlgI
MGVNVREALALKPLPVRWTVYYAFFAAIIILSYVTDNSGFMYAAF